eukprot:4190255-Prorocentrum_lima.AAC.1
MTSSLVGSEMCIRDRSILSMQNKQIQRTNRSLMAQLAHQRSFRLLPVSYTHLTLPTICSV